MFPSRLMMQRTSSEFSVSVRKYFSRRASSSSASRSFARSAASLHGAAHGGRQPFRLLLEQVIRRARLEAFNRRLLANRAGHQDERHVRTLFSSPCASASKPVNDGR